MDSGAVPSHHPFEVSRVREDQVPNGQVLDNISFLCVPEARVQGLRESRLGTAAGEGTNGGSGYAATMSVSPRTNEKGINEGILVVRMYNATAQEQ